MHKLKAKKILMLKPGQIRVEKSRMVRHTDNDSIKGLVESVSANGVIEPLLIRRGEDGGYILVAGYRRLRAANAVGLRRIPCLLYSVDKKEGLLYSVTENLQRKPPDPFYEAQEIYKLITYYSFSKTEAAIRLGLTFHELSYKLRLLELDSSVTEKLRTSGFGEEHARLLLLLPQFKREQIAECFIEKGLSLNEARRLVEAELDGKAEAAPPAPAVRAEVQKPVRKYAIGDVRLFANSLSKLTDTLKSAGFCVTSRKSENDKYIEYKVRIKKEQTENGEFKQLKIAE